MKNFIFVLVVIFISCEDSSLLNNNVVLSPVENLDFTFDRFIQNQNNEPVTRSQVELFNIKSADTLTQKKFFLMLLDSCIEKSKGNYLIVKEPSLFKKIVQNYRNEIFLEPHFILAYINLEQKLYVFLIDDRKKVSLNHVGSNFIKEGEWIKGEISNDDFLRNYEAIHLEKPLFVSAGNAIIATSENLKIDYNLGKVKFKITDPNRLKNLH